MPTQEMPTMKPTGPARAEAEALELLCNEGSKPTTTFEHVVPVRTP